VAAASGCTPQQKVEESCRALRWIFVERFSGSQLCFNAHARQRRPGLHSNFSAKKNPASRRSGSHEYLYIAPNQRESYEFYFGREMENHIIIFSLASRGAAEGHVLLSSPFAIQITAMKFIAHIFERGPGADTLKIKLQKVINTALAVPKRMPILRKLRSSQCHQILKNAQPNFCFCSYPRKIILN
jgi:hypothetical protein